MESGLKAELHTAKEATDEIFHLPKQLQNPVCLCD